MSAEILRRAAEQARATAETHRAIAPHLADLYGDDCGSECQAVRDFAVAWVLEAAAEHIESHDCEAHCEPNGCDQVNAAFDLARAYLGGVA